MSGLFSAAFLRQIGWRAEVYERSPVELVGRGAGITTHPELLEALEKSGAGTGELGIVVEKRIALDHDKRFASKAPEPARDYRGRIDVGPVRRRVPAADRLAHRRL